jgi:tRNA(fMet)-specific endonuclease VapC
MESLIFDTTFLIDLQRERRKGGGAAHQFLERNRDAIAYLPVTAYGEFAEGFADHGDPVFLAMVESFEVLEVTSAVAETYGQLARELRASGKMIGANDLWIGATALCHGYPLVTRNLEHFTRLPGLQVRGY